MIHAFEFDVRMIMEPAAKHHDLQLHQASSRVIRKDIREGGKGGSEGEKAQEQEKRGKEKQGEQRRPCRDPRQR